MHSRFWISLFSFFFSLYSSFYFRFLEMYPALNIFLRIFLQINPKKVNSCYAPEKFIRETFVVKDKSFISVSIFVASLITNARRRKEFESKNRAKWFSVSLEKNYHVTEILFNDTDFPRSFFHTCSTTEIKSISRLKTREENYYPQYWLFKRFLGTLYYFRKKNK